MAMHDARWLETEPGPTVADPAAVPSAATPSPLGVLSDGVSVETVRDMLHEVIDPELGVDIVELGLLREVTIQEGVARIRFTVTTPACPLSSYIEDEIRMCLMQLPDLHELDVDVVMQPPWKPEDMSEAARVALGWES